MTKEIEIRIGVQSITKIKNTFENLVGYANFLPSLTMQEFKEEPNFDGGGGGEGRSQRPQPEEPSSDAEYSPGHK